MKTYPISNNRRTRRIRNPGADKYRMPASFSTYINRLSGFREDLATTREIFAQSRVWPDQCSYIIKTFEPVQRTAIRLAESCRFKNERKKSPDPNRYTILANACDFYDQLDRTISSIRVFGETSRQGPGNKSTLREIQSALGQLDLSFNDLMKGLDG